MPALGLLLSLSLLPLLALLSLPALGQPSASGTTPFASAGDISSVAAGDLVADDTFVDELLVFEVVLPVRVLVGDEPVRGLQRENFEVWEGERQLRVVGFEQIDLTATGERNEDASPGAVGDLPTGSQAEGSVDEATGETPAERHFLALFDLAQSPGFRLKQAVRSVRRMLDEQLHSSDRMGVAVLTWQGARLLAPLTRDRDTLSAALDLVVATLDLDRKGQAEARGRLASRPRQNLRELTQSVGPTAALALGGTQKWGGLVDPALTRVLDPRANTLAGTLSGLDSGPEADFSISSELEGFAVLSGRRRLARSVSDLVTLLGDVTGDKYLLYFAAGIPNFESAIQAPLEGAGLLKSYNGMVEAMLRAGWVLNAFDVAGVGRGAPGSLFYLADETGGDLWENYNNLEVATGRLVEETAVSYRLIFQSGEVRRDGRFHPVEVRLVDAPNKARVQGRLGYSAPKRAKKWTRLEQKLAAADQLFRSPDRSGLPVSLSLLTSPELSGAEESSRHRLTLVVELDADALSTTLPANWLDRRLAFEISAYAASGPVSQYGDGVVLDILRERLEFRDESLRSSLRDGFRFVGDLEVPSGTHEVRVRVVEPRSGASFLSTQSATVRHASGSTRLVAYFAASGGGVRSREATTEVHSAASSPLVVEGSSFVPAVRPTTAAGDRLPLVLRCYGLCEGAPDLELRDGEDRPVGVQGQLLTPDRAVTLDDGRVLTGFVETVDLAPGDYRLLVLWNRDEVLRSAAGLEFRVR